MATNGKEIAVGGCNGRERMVDGGGREEHMYDGMYDGSNNAYIWEEKCYIFVLNITYLG